MNAAADGGAAAMPKPDANSENARVITADEYFHAYATPMYAPASGKVTNGKRC